MVYTIPVGDSAGLNARFAARQPILTPDGRFLHLWFRLDTLLRFDTRNPSIPPAVIAGAIPTVFFEHTHDGHTPVSLASSSALTWRFTIPVDTARTARVVDRAPQTVLAALSPDGQVVARVERRPGGPLSELVLVGLSTGSRRTLMSVGGLLTTPKWSPDGNRIALRLHDQGMTGRLIVVDVRDATIERFGSVPVRRRSTLVQVGFPVAWSPDGKALYATEFDSIPHQRVRKYTVGAVGDTGIIVSNLWEKGGDKPGNIPEGIVVAPNGEAIVVGGADVNLIPLNGGAARQLVGYDSLTLHIPVAWLGAEIMYVTRDWRAARATSDLGMRDVWIVPARGGSPRHAGVLPAGCHPSFTLLNGATEAACYRSESSVDIWFYPPIRR